MVWAYFSLYQTVTASVAAEVAPAMTQDFGCIPQEADSHDLWGQVHLNE